MSRIATGYINRPCERVGNRSWNQRINPMEIGRVASKTSGAINGLSLRRPELLMNFRDAPWKLPLEYRPRNSFAAVPRASHLSHAASFLSSAVVGYVPLIPSRRYFSATPSIQKMELVWTKLASFGPDACLPR